jgi:hypothetical protein
MLADQIDDAIATYKKADAGGAVRLSAVLDLFSLALKDSSDKRGVSTLATALFDSYANVRGVAAGALISRGLVDWTINPCLRNTIIVRLQYLTEKETSETVKSQATKTYEFLMGLGLFDKNYSPADQKCINGGMDVRPGGTGGGGPLVPWDPNAKPAPSKMPFAQKFALVAVAMTIAGGVAVAVFWPRKR